MLRALIIVASLSLPLIASSAAAGADFETLHRAAREHSGWRNTASGATFDGQFSTDISVATFSTVGCRAN